MGCAQSKPRKDDLNQGIVAAVSSFEVSNAHTALQQSLKSPVCASSTAIANIAPGSTCTPTTEIREAQENTKYVSNVFSPSFSRCETAVAAETATYTLESTPSTISAKAAGPIVDAIDDIDNVNDVLSTVAVNDDDTDDESNTKALHAAGACDASSIVTLDAGCANDASSIETIDACGANDAPSIETVDACGANDAPSIETLDACGANDASSVETFDACGANDAPSVETLDACGANDASSTEKFVLRVATSEHNEPPRRVVRRRLRTAERDFIWEQTGRRCYMCKTALPRKGSWHIEHVLAFSADPRANDVLGNMLAACSVCNRRKLDRPLMECVRLGIACDLATSSADGEHLNTAARACLLAALRVKHNRQHCNARAWGPSGPTRARCDGAHVDVGAKVVQTYLPPASAESSDGQDGTRMEASVMSQSAIDDAIDAVEHEVHANASTVLAAGDVSVDWEQTGVTSGAFGEVYKGSLRLRSDRKSKNDGGGGAQLEDEDEHQDEHVDVGVKLSKGFVRSSDHDNIDGDDGSGVILAELVALRSLCMHGQHRNIVRFYGVVSCTPFDEGESSPQASPPRRLSGLVFEWCDFHLMSICVARFGNVVELVAQAADALAFLHSRSFLHRDVKPHNVLVKKSAQMPWSSAVVKLADFGTAKRVLAPHPEGEFAAKQPGHGDGAQLTPHVGTFDYRAPEAEHGRYYEQTDVYALGKTMYILQRQKWNAIFRPVTGTATQGPDSRTTRSTVRCVKRGWEETWRACVIETPHTARPTAAEVRDRLRRLQRAEPPPPTLRTCARQNTATQRSRNVALATPDKRTAHAAAATTAATVTNAAVVPTAVPLNAARGASATAGAGAVSGNCETSAASSPWLTDQWVIVSQRATRRGNWKYHRLEGCGNMVAPRRISIEEAERLGCAPCRQCCRVIHTASLPHRTVHLSHEQSPNLPVPSPQALPSPLRKRTPWTEQEEANLRAGVSRFAGERQKWKRILDAYAFADGRTNVDLKDKWRNLQQRDKKDGGCHALPSLPQPTMSSTQGTLVSQFGFKLQRKGGMTAVAANTCGLREKNDNRPLARTPRNHAASQGDQQPHEKVPAGAALMQRDANQHGDPGVSVN